MWTYEQSSGHLYHDDGLPWFGYSGTGEGKNDPALEGVVGVGPIPRGFYDIGAPEDVLIPGPHGPYVLRLTPRAGTDTHGRDGFLIHGDSIEHPGAASHECIVVSLHARQDVARSGDPLLRVVA